MGGFVFTRGVYVTQHRAPDVEGYGSRSSRRAQRYEAFVPAPIADVELTLSGSVSADVSDAEAALARFTVAAGRVPGLDALARSLLRSEAVASSWIEALRVSHRRLAEAEHGAPGASYDEARRVVGNVAAMSRAIELGAETTRALAGEDLLSMHGMLMAASAAAPDRDRAGAFRVEPVFVGGTSPATAEYVGPPAEEIERLIGDLVALVNDRTDLSGVVVAGLAHAQFETIHPFHDGNGRVGRCLVHTLLRRSGLVEDIPIPLSVVLARRGSDYVDGLNAFRSDDLDGWLSFFATSVRAAAEAAGHFSVAVEALQTDWRDRIAAARRRAGTRTPRSDATVLQLVQSLAGMPVFTINDVADRLSVTWKTAETAVTELATVGVAREVTAGRRNRVYEAVEIFDLVDRFEAEGETFRP